MVFGTTPSNEFEAGFFSQQCDKELARYREEARKVNKDFERAISFSMSSRTAASSDEYRQRIMIQSRYKLIRWIIIYCYPCLLCTFIVLHMQLL